MYPLFSQMATILDFVGICCLLTNGSTYSFVWGEVANKITAGVNVAANYVAIINHYNCIQINSNGSSASRL